VPGFLEEFQEWERSIEEDAVEPDAQELPAESLTQALRTEAGIDFGSATREAATQDPVALTRAAKAGRPFAVPGSMVGEHVQEYERRQKVIRQNEGLADTRYAERYPELVRHFSDRENSLSGWDDVLNIGGVIDSVFEATGISKVREAHRSGQAGVDMVSVVSEVMRADRAGELLDPRVMGQFERLKEAQSAYDPGDIGFEDVIPLIAQQVPNFALMAKYGLAGGGLAGIASAATGFSTAPVAIPLGATAGAVLAMSPVEFTSAYMEYRELQDEAGNRLDPDIAIGMAAAYGMVSAGVEVGGTAAVALLSLVSAGTGFGAAVTAKATSTQAGKLLLRKSLANSIKGALQGKSKRDLFKAMGVAIGAGVVTEGAQEGTQQWFQIAGGVAAQAAERSRTGAFEELEAGEELFGAETRGEVFHAATLGAVVGGGITTGTATVGGASGLAARTISGRTAAADTFAAKLLKLEEVREGSRLAKEDPVAFAEAIETETKNIEPVNVDAAGLVTFFQGDLAAIEAAVPSLSREQITEAADAGMDVQVPFSEFVAHISGSKLSEGFIENARVDGRALTLSQIDTLLEDLDEQVAQIDDEDFSSEDYNAFVTDIFDQLTGAGVSERVARMTSKVWGAAQFNLAERAGMDPLEEYAGAQITGPAGAGRARALFQPVADSEAVGEQLQLFPSEAGLAEEVQTEALSLASQIIDSADPDNEIVLFNSATAERDPDIQNFGVIAQHGEWVTEILQGATGSEETIQELLDRPGPAFFDDTPSWVTMQVARKLNKNVGQVTIGDVREHGQLSIVKVDKDNTDFVRIPEEGDGVTVENLRGEGYKFWETDAAAAAESEEIPFSAERRDILTFQDVAPDITLTGDDLVTFLQSRFPEANITERGSALFQPAFHGTAAKFDKFTLDHIGTGEGAQAFGWGLYFAELRDVAELYREQQTGAGTPVVVVDGVVIERGSDLFAPELVATPVDRVAMARALAELRSNAGDIDATRAALDVREIADIARTSPDNRQATENVYTKAAELLESLRGRNIEVREPPKGQVFKVDLPEDSELLDYDKPLSEQPEGVREKIATDRGLWIPHQETGSNAFDGRAAAEHVASQLDSETDIRPDPERRGLFQVFVPWTGTERLNTGRDFYEELSGYLRTTLPQEVRRGPEFKKGDEAASKALLAAGIPGLKYFDGFSRTKEQGTSNYVIWDETAINILQTFFQPQGRAEVSFSERGELLINLKAAADESTALHEFSHGFLDKMVRLGENLEAEHQINQDLGIIREWWKGESKSVLKWLKDNQSKLPLGAFEEIMDRGGASYIAEQALTANLDLNADMDLAAQGATIGFHEHFARGAELYMYEGKAPSSQLREAFAAFTDWMVEVYKDVKSALGVELNDNVRSVFDRLVASDAQIEAAQRERADELQNIESALELSPKAAEELQAAKEQKAREAKQTVRQRALKAERRKRKQLESSLRPDIEREVEQELSNQRDYQAHDYVKARKLNRPAVVSLVTKELASAASRFTSPKGPTLPEELQGRYGYNSVPEMLETLAGLPPIKQAVKEETDRRLLERLGPPEVEEAVESTVESTAGQEKVLKAELAAIAGQAAVGRAARLRVAETGAVTPAEQKAAREAAQEALDAATTPEETAAAQLELARLEAERAPSEQERRSAASRRDQEASVRRQARASASELKALADARVARLPSKDVKPERFLRAQDQARRETDKALRARNYALALEHQRRRVMLHFAHGAALRAQKKIKAARKRATRLQKASTQKAIGASMPSALEQINSLLERAGVLGARIRNFADISHPPLSKWVDDREAAGEDAGAVSSFMLGHIPEFDEMQLHQIEAFDETLEAIHEIAKLSDVVIIDGESHKLADIVDTLAASIEANDRSREKIPSKDRNVIGFVPLAKRTLRRFDASLIKVEQIIDWLDGGDIEGPMREFVFTQVSAAQAKEADMQRDIPHKIIAAFEALSKRRLNTKIFIPEVDETFRVSDIMSVALNLGTESSYQKVKDGEGWTDEQINAILAHLEDAELDTVEEIWSTLEELGVLLFDTHEQLTGIRPSKLETRSFTMPGGREMSGGYYPAVYDPTKSEQGARNYESGNAPIFENNYTTRGVDTTSGATIGRTGFAAPFWFDMAVLPSHVSEVIHDVTHRQALNNVWRVVGNKKVAGAIDESLGVEYRELFKPWLQSIGNDKVGVNKDLRVWARMFSSLRTNTAIMAMGLKATTQLSQVAGFSNSMGRAFEAGYRGELLNQMRLAIIHPIEMRDYAFAKSGEMRNRAKNLDRDLRDVGRKLAGKSGVLQKSQQFSMHGIAVMDLVVSVPTWHAGYNAALKQGMSEEAAIQFGDREVRLSQGGGGAKDLADVQRGAEFWKLFTNFYSFLSALYSQIRDTGHQVHSIGDVPQAMAKYFFYVTVGSMMAEALSNRWPDEDDDMTALEMALWKSATAPLTTVPILREFVGVVESGRTFKLSPTQAAGESLARVLTQTIDLFDGDSDLDIGKFSKDTLQLTGYMLGLPINQLQITFTNVRRVIEEGADYNAWDILFYQKEE